MCWNDSKQRQTFINSEKKLMEKYLKLGMDKKDVDLIYTFDFKTYKSDRSFYMKESSFDEFSNDANENILYQITDDKDVYDLSIEHTDRFYWLNEIEDELLYKVIKRLDDNQKELLTLIFVDGFSMTYIAENIYHVSVSTITRKSKLLYEKIKKSYKEMELNRYEISI